MVTYSLKKSYRLKDLKQKPFKDLWGLHGIFTTMWIFGKPVRILFFKNHIKNLIKSLNVYGIKNKNLKKKIIKIININLSKKKNYNHLLRVALNKDLISISLRKKISPKLDFDLKLINLKREKPNHKNLKYKRILSHLKKIDNSKSDIGIVNKKRILETGTSNLVFIKNDKAFTPIKDYYVGNTYKYLKSKFKKIVRKEIFVDDIKKFDEILLFGSGKGVASVKTIKQVGWKRKSLKNYKIFLKYYQSAIKKSHLYKF